MALDTRGRPYHTGRPNDCRGLATIDPEAGTVEYGLPYYEEAHFSAFVDRGAVRVASSEPIGTRVRTMAIRNPDGRLVLLVHNGDTDRPHPLRVTLRGRSFTTSVPAGGSATFRWRSDPWTVERGLLMRVLFGAVPAHDHLLPLASLMRAPIEDGHAAPAVTSAGVAAVVREELPAGVEHLQAGPMPSRSHSRAHVTGRDLMSPMDAETVGRIFGGARLDATIDRPTAAGTTPSSPTRATSDTTPLPPTRSLRRRTPTMCSRRCRPVFRTAEPHRLGS